MLLYLVSVVIFVAIIALYTLIAMSIGLKMIVTHLYAVFIFDVRIITNINEYLWKADGLISALTRVNLFLYIQFAIHAKIEVNFLCFTLLSDSVMCCFGWFFTFLLRSALYGFFYECFEIYPK